MNGSSRKRPSLARVADHLRSSGVLFADSRTVFAVLAFCTIASLFLFIRIDRSLDPDLDKDWWTLSFQRRDSGSLSFTVANHSRSSNFSYTVTHDRESIDAGSFVIEPGSERTVTPSVPALPGRTIVSVSNEDGTTQEIYREHRSDR